MFVSFCLSVWLLAFCVFCVFVFLFSGVCVFFWNMLYGFLLRSFCLLSFWFWLGACVISWQCAETVVQTTSKTSMDNNNHDISWLYIKKGKSNIKQQKREQEFCPEMLPQIQVRYFSTKMLQIPFRSQIEQSICCKHCANSSGEKHKQICFKPKPTLKKHETNLTYTLNQP